MTDKKHTQGPVEVLPSGLAVAAIDPRKVMCTCWYGADSALVGAVIHLDEAKSNAALIAEAFNIAAETGKTPRQLADSNAELVAAMDAIHEISNSTPEINMSNYDDNDISALNDAIVSVWKFASAAKAKAGG